MPRARRSTPRAAARAATAGAAGPVPARARVPARAPVPAPPRRGPARVPARARGRRAASAGRRWKERSPRRRTGARAASRGATSTGSRRRRRAQAGQPARSALCGRAPRAPVRAAVTSDRSYPRWPREHYPERPRAPADPNRSAGCPVRDRNADSRSGGPRPRCRRRPPQAIASRPVKPGGTLAREDLDSGARSSENRPMVSAMTRVRYSCHHEPRTRTRSWAAWRSMSFGGAALDTDRRRRRRYASSCAPPAARAGRRPAARRLSRPRHRDGRRPVPRDGPGLRERRHRGEAARGHGRARRPRAGSAPHRGHEPERLLRPTRRAQRRVRPRGVAGRVPHDPAGERPPSRRAEPRGGPAARPRRGRGDRARHRGGAARRGGTVRGRRLRDRGRDSQPAHLGPRLRAVRPAEADGAGGRAGPALAERPARRELGVHHRRGGREERVLRLRAGRPREGGRGRAGRAGVRAGVPGGHERVLVRFNLGYERELGRDLAASIDLLHDRSDSLMSNFDATWRPRLATPSAAPCTRDSGSIPPTGPSWCAPPRPGPTTWR